jgi:hypothetical protein
MAYRHIASTHFNVTNRVDLASNHHLLTLNVHLGSSSFHIINIYHNTDHPASLRSILDLDLDLVTPTIVGGDFNTHAHVWSLPGIHPSPWALNLKEWALSQTLDLLSPPGVPTCRGEGCQHNITIDLVWANTAAVLDKAFQDLTINFTTSISSDHAGLWVNYQHILDSAIKHNPHLTSFLIKDEAKDTWIHHLSVFSHFSPFDLSSSTLIDQEADHLSQDIEETCQAVFEKRKQFSPKAASWWDEECSKATTAV